ncbi:GNAT family N-acetyltransferase [Streptomyces sp. Y1]|uniref:GNAT family N-acetyltransferase n=1 Tax=Streptomyces sp. Y1 TaxID=3238634 RepID=A0AB39TK29_9ACTN
MGSAIEWAGDPVSFRPATGERIDEVLGVLDEAGGWLHARGITTQWPTRFDPSWVAGDIARGETWLVSVGGELSGTVTLNWSDALWTDLGGEAGYVHRLAVRRRARGLGGLILDWAGERAARHGADALRLDCVAHNPALRAYYEGQGFSHRGDAPGQWGEAPPVWLSRYERPSAR